MIKKKIKIGNARFFSPIGYYEEERILKGVFYVTLEVVYSSQDEDADSDNLNNTLNYELLYDLVSQVMRKERKLLESAAQDILDGVQELDASVCETYVEIIKQHPPFYSSDAHTSVSLRQRK